MNLVLFFTLLAHLVNTTSKLALPGNHSVVVHIHGALIAKVFIVFSL